MAGPSSSLLAADLDRDVILQNFGVSYEELLFYMNLNTIGNQVCTSSLPVESRAFHLPAIVCHCSRGALFL